MKAKFFSMMMAALVTCSAMVFTSCSSDDDNNAAYQANKNRSEFVEHCRANLKNLAENLNFSSWVGINQLNNDFNTNVLNNPAFEKTISTLFLQQIQQSIQPVEEGSELAQKGYQNYAVIDFSSFNYRFTQNADNTAFDVTPAEDFQLVYKRTRPQGGPAPEGGDIPPMPEGDQPGDEYECLVLKASGGYSDMIAARFSSPALAIIVRIPTNFEFIIGRLVDDGSIDPLLTGTFKNEYYGKEGSSFVDISSDSWNISGTLNSSVKAPTPRDGEGLQGPERPGRGPQDDATTLIFSVLSDKVNKKHDIALSWEQNGRKMVEMNLKESGDGIGGIYNIDFSEFSASSIHDVMAVLLNGHCLDEGKLTLLDDLTTTVSVTDMQKATKVSQELTRARRNYADETTIDKYTQQLNELIKAEMTCKGVNQTFPMKFATTKFGVDWWSMPAFCFAAGSDYVPITEMLDEESIRYMINIADHAAEPMQQSLVTVRQLMQYVQTIIGAQQSNP